MEPNPRAARKVLLIKLAVAAVVLGTAGVLLLRGMDVHAELKRLVADITKAGPLASFSAMAILPAFGMPAFPFMFAVLPAFGPTLGIPLAMALALAALTVNMVFTYWLARYALRAWLARVIGRLGYKMPHVPPGDTTALIVLLRVTPGVPAFVQNYLLGLSDTPFLKFLLVSCLCAWPHISAWIYFGEVLGEGKGGLILIGSLLLVAVFAAARLVRHHYGKKAAKPHA